MIHTRHAVAFFSLLLAVLIITALSVTLGKEEETAALPLPTFGSAQEHYDVIVKEGQEELNRASIRESLIAKLRTRDIPEALEEEQLSEDREVVGDSDSQAEVSAYDSILLDYMFDGYGIYSGVERGKEITAADLDTCGGHKHLLLTTGSVTYHYHVVAGMTIKVGCEPPLIMAVPEPEPANIMPEQETAGEPAVVDKATAATGNSAEPLPSE